MSLLLPRRSLLLPTSVSLATTWRLELDSDNGGGLFDFDEVYFNHEDEDLVVTQGGTASASSEFSANNEAADAFNRGGDANRWASLTGTNEWIEWTFPTPQQVTEVGIVVGIATSRAPNVWRVKADGTTVQEFSTPSGWAVNGRRTFWIGDTLAPSYRYWRVQSETNNGDGGIAFQTWEFEWLLSGIDQSSGATASASSEFDAGNSAANAIDDNAGTPWASADNSQPQWHQCDFGSAQQIDAWSHNPWSLQRSPRHFVIQGSDDGSTWHHVRRCRKSDWVANTPEIINFTTFG